jgi:hypothetical protein
MRKLWIATAATLATSLAVAAVAVAATQVNTYTVTGAIKGGKGATKKSPKATAVDFDFTVGEENGLRPSPVTKYAINFGGLTVPNNTAFAGCDVKKLNAPGSKGLSECPAKSIMGKGQLVNEVGVHEDTSDKHLYCYLTLTAVNGTKKNQFLLWLEGGPKASSDDKKNCVTPISQAIDAKFVKKSSGVSLQFGVPDNLLHPGGALDNGLTNATTSIKKATTKVKGKKIGYFESIKCTGTTTISVDFTQESDGSKKTASKVVPCK